MHIHPLTGFRDESGTVDGKRCSVLEGLLRNYAQLRCFPPQRCRKSMGTHGSGMRRRGLRRTVLLSLGVLPSVLRA